MKAYKKKLFQTEETLHLIFFTSFSIDPKTAKESKDMECEKLWTLRN